MARLQVATRPPPPKASHRNPRRAPRGSVPELRLRRRSKQGRAPRLPAASAPTASFWLMGALPLHTARQCPLAQRLEYFENDGGITSPRFGESMPQHVFRLTGHPLAQIREKSLDPSGTSVGKLGPSVAGE